MNVNRLLLICILFIVSASLFTNVSAAPTSSIDVDITEDVIETTSPEITPEEPSEPTQETTGKLFSLRTRLIVITLNRRINQ